MGAFQFFKKQIIMRKIINYYLKNYYLLTYLYSLNCMLYVGK